ncbi:MAG: hypothetical protein ABIJ16_13270, partial [Bacteroidota bacterium]
MINIRQIIRVIIVNIFALFIYVNCVAQNQEIIDSLERIIVDIESKNAEICAGDTNRIIAYVLWGEHIYLYMPDSALVLWKRANSISEKILLTKPAEATVKITNNYQAVALNDIGFYYQMQGHILYALD